MPCLAACRSCLFVLLLALAQAAGPASAQTTFTDVTPTSGAWVTGPDEDFWVNSVAPADIDGDGDTDLAVLGYHVVYNVSAEDRLVLCLNQGPDATGRWTLTEVLAPLGGLWAGSSDLAWGDVDGDGDPDLVVGSEGEMRLLRNDTGTLVLTDTLLPAYAEDSAFTGAFDMRSLTWADFDNDGDQDLCVPSSVDPVTFEHATRILRNDGPDGTGGWIFAAAGVGVDPTTHAQTAWADDDGDLDLDLFVAEVDNVFGLGYIKRFRNDGGTLVGQDLLDIRINYGMADWADQDSDGDLDIVVAGNIEEADGSFTTVLRLYRNDAGTYVATDVPGDWLDLNAVTWADYDSDGDVDVLVTGSFVDNGEIVGRSTVLANVGGTVTDIGVVLPAPMSSLGRGGSFTWFDVDDDGDLDYFVAGAYYVPGGNGLVEARMNLYLNDAPTVNAAPSAPPLLRSTPGTSDVLLSWDAAADDHTPGAALTYDLQVRPLGAVTASNARSPEPGNVSATTDWTLSGLAAGTYEWSVRGVDNSLASGPTARGTFTVGNAVTPPPVVADGRFAPPLLVAKVDPAGTSLLLTWDVGPCPGAVDQRVLHGLGAQLPSAPGGAFGLSGAACSVVSPFSWSPAPDPAGDPARLAWFIVVTTDGAGNEGPWGSGSAGEERQGPGDAGASGACGVVTKTLANGCGR